VKTNSPTTSVSDALFMVVPPSQMGSAGSDTLRTVGANPPPEPIIRSPTTSTLSKIEI
jgi:hypothetical protein